MEQYLGYFAPGGEGGADWRLLALIASTLVVLVYGLFLGIARAFNLNELERYSKSEIPKSSPSSPRRRVKRRPRKWLS